MNRTLPLAVLGSILALAASLQAKTITVTTADNISPPAGQTNLVQAINLLQDGDTIQFNIPGAGVHYLATPPDGFPLITKNNITIDGYSQPGASPNTNPIHAPNNAQIKVVLASTNENALSMGTAVAAAAGVTYNNLGFGDDELAILGFFRGTNASVKGLAFISAPTGSGSGASGDIKSVCFCADAPEVSSGNCGNWHVSGCWFGIHPGTGQVAYMDDGTTVAIPTIAIAAYRTRNNDGSNATYPQPGTIGVAAGSTKPRAEFNVFVEGYGFDSEGLNFRVSGNFFNVLPDGLHNFDPSTANSGQQQGDGDIEVGRVCDNLIIGTDGDGVNDADEGNLFGGVANTDWDHLYLWSAHATNVVIAGNWYGIGVDGSTIFSNSSVVVHGVSSTTTVQFGSDFDGVSDALEGNVVYNNNPFADLYPTPDPLGFPEPLLFEGGKQKPAPQGSRFSVRGNSLVNNTIVPFTWADGVNGLLETFTNYESLYMSTNVPIIPWLNSTSSIYPTLVGTFPPGIAPYTNVSIDVYQLDPQGWQNGQAFAMAELTDYSTYTNGFPQGSKFLGTFPVANSGDFRLNLSGLDLGPGWVTVTANYSADPAGTPRGRTHTGNFSNPGTLNPGEAASVGITHTVPDVQVWYNQVGNFPTNGPLKLAEAITPLGNWEPYISVLGESTFLIGLNTFATDLANQNFVVVKQPAAGGSAKLDYEFYDDSGAPFKGVINLSRPNGNPQRVAGDKRTGAVHFITEAETSMGQISAFQTVSRWGNNPIYQADNRYCTEQLFSLDPATLTQTPVTNAWDYVYGAYSASALGGANGGNQLSRTGGRSEFLDNGNIVVMIDDKTALVSTSGEVTTFAIIKPDGTQVKGPTLVDPRDIWDNMAAYKGGFAIRVHNMLYFYDNNGTLLHTNDVVVSSGLSFETGRGDGNRIGSDIRSYYVYLAGQTPATKTSPVSVAIWDSRTGNFVAKATVTDGDPAVYLTDRVTVAVDALDRFCVVYGYQPNAEFQQQVAARVMAFDGQNISYLTHSFFPFVNSETGSTNLVGLTTTTASVAMTTSQICISAKGTVNSTNNPAGGPDTPAQTALYTVIKNPADTGSSTGPQITASQIGSGAGHTFVISWPSDGNQYVLQTSSSLNAGSWSNVSPQPPQNVVGNTSSMSVLITGGNAYFRLAR
jgi:hypothetical protein